MTQPVRDLESAVWENRGKLLGANFPLHPGHSRRLANPPATEPSVCQTVQVSHLRDSI